MKALWIQSCHLIPSSSYFLCSRLVLLARQLLCFKPSLINLIRTPSLKLSMPEHRNTHPVDSAPSPSGLFSSSLFTGARWTLPTEMFHVASCDTTAGPTCRPCFPREAPAVFTLVLGRCTSRVSPPITNPINQTHSPACS